MQLGGGRVKVESARCDGAAQHSVLTVARLLTSSEEVVGGEAIGAAAYGEITAAKIARCPATECSAGRVEVGSVENGAAACSRRLQKPTRRTGTGIAKRRVRCVLRTAGIRASRDDAGAVVRVIQWDVVQCRGICTAGMLSGTSTTVDCGTWVVVGARAVGAPGVEAAVVFKIRGPVVVHCCGIHAAGHSIAAEARQSRRGEIVDCSRIHAAVKLARAVILVGNGAEIERGRVGAASKDDRA